MNVPAKGTPESLFCSGDHVAVLVSQTAGGDVAVPQAVSVGDAGLACSLQSQNGWVRGLQVLRGMKNSCLDSCGLMLNRLALLHHTGRWDQTAAGLSPVDIMEQTKKFSTKYCMKKVGFV